jgi:phosphoglycolate phosphatase-like HAD superfamily hydrolase
MIRCISFDFDGTLAQSNEIKRRGYFEAAARYHCPDDVVAEVIDRTKGDRYAVLGALANEIAARKLKSEGETVEQAAQRMADCYSNYCERQIAACPEVPGVGVTLERLAAAGVSLYMNSATPDVALQRIADLRGISRYFRDVLGGRWTKAGNLQHIMRLEACGAGELAHVGDSEDDRLAAVDTGCCFIGFVDPAGGRSRFRQVPDTIVNDLTALVGMLSGVPAGLAFDGAGVSE